MKKLSIRQHIKTVRKAWKVSGLMKRDNICTKWNRQKRVDLFRQAYSVEVNDACNVCPSLGIRY